VSNNICSKVLTIHWLRNGRICYRYFISEETGRSWCKPGVGNLSQVASQKQTLQGMAGRTNFPSTIPFPLLLLNLGNSWNFNQINSWFSQFVMKAQKCDTEHIYSTMRKEGRSIKYNTVRLTIYSHYNLVKVLWARWFCFAGRRLSTPDVNKEKSGRKKTRKYDSSYLNLNFTVAETEGLSIRNVLFVAKF